MNWNTRAKYTIVSIVLMLILSVWLTETYVDARSRSRSSSRSYSGSSSKSSSFGSRNTTRQSSTKTNKKQTTHFGSTKKKATKDAKTFGSSKNKSTVKKNKQTAALAKQKRAAKVKSNRRTVMNKKKVAASKARVANTKRSVQNTSKKDWDTKRSTYMKGKSTYTPTRATASRYSGNQRTVVINRYHNGYGGYYYNDPFNHSLIWSFSTIWWYHHWSGIDRSHYANDARMRNLEAEIAKMKARNVAVNADYTDKGMDNTVMYGDGYLENVKNGNISETTYKSKTNIGTIILIVLLSMMIAALLGYMYHRRVHYRRIDSQRQ